MSATGPSVVAIGGGHGTAVTLRAARRYAGTVTGIVSVADDGGSSGRLRELLNVVALGDIRKCLVALADEDSALAAAFERRFDEGELAGHALGNLILTGLIDATGDLVLGVREAAQLLGRARRRPAGHDGARRPEGRVGSGHRGRAGGGHGDERHPDCLARPGGRAAAAPGLGADRGGGPDRDRARVVVHQRAGRRGGGRHRRGGGIVGGPGRLRLQPATPGAGDPGYDVAAHVAALARHDVSVDLVLCDSIQGMSIGATDVPVRDVPLTGENTLVHSPAKLAQALSGLLA